MIALIHTQWDKMKETPVSAQELQDARTYLTGSLPLSLTSTDSIAGILLSLQMDDLPIDYLDRRQARLAQITVQDVQAVAQRILDKNQFTTVLVGNPKDIEDTEAVSVLPNVE